MNQPNANKTWLFDVLRQYLFITNHSLTNSLIDTKGRVRCDILCFLNSPCKTCPIKLFLLVLWKLNCILIILHHSHPSIRLVILLSLQFSLFSGHLKIWHAFILSQFNLTILLCRLLLESETFTFNSPLFNSLATLDLTCRLSDSIKLVF